MDLKWFRREAEKHVPNEANRHVPPTVAYCGTCGGECRYKGPLVPAPTYMRITGPEMLALLDVADAAREMVELERRRMREHDFFDEMKPPYDCPCLPCKKLRAALGKLDATT